MAHVLNPPGKPPLSEPEQEVLEVPDYDSWYSAITSFTLHFFAVLLIGLMSAVLVTREALPPAVTVVAVAETASTGGDTADDAPGDTPQITQEKTNTDKPLPSKPSETITKVTPIDAPEVELTKDQSVEVIKDQLQGTRAAAAAAKAAATKRLGENLGGAAGGGNKGQGGGRAGRAARWILRFNTSSAREYLAQLGGLGADIAFPQRGDTYLYFTNLGQNPTSQQRDLARENRIFWMDENPQSFGPVKAELGVNAAPFMIAFLPIPLEKKMLELEKAYKGIQDEDAILQTVFECVRRGGGYDVIVVDQKLRGK